MTASPPLPAGPEIVDPAPDAFVLPFNRLKPGFDPEQLPRFRDLAWRLALISPRESSRSLVIDWSRCPAGLRPGMMRAAFAEIHVPTPAVLLQQRASRSTTQPGTLRHNFQIWIRFAIWLDGRGITELSQVTTGDLEAYAEHLRPLGRRWRTDAKALWMISRLWVYAPYLPERDRLVMPPWEDPAAVMSDFLGTNDDTPDGENNVAIVHPAVMAPLLVWALRTVLDLAPDILAAAREHRRLLASIPDRAPRGGTETAVAHLRGLLAAGQQLPPAARPAPPPCAPASAGRCRRWPTPTWPAPSASPPPRSPAPAASWPTSSLRPTSAPPRSSTSRSPPASAPHPGERRSASTTWTC